MNNFENVCLQSFDNWVNSFPIEIPEHNFSQEHINNINSLLEQKQTDKKVKISKNTLRFLLIAAILLSISITVFAFPTSREFIVNKFFNRSEYNVSDTKDTYTVESLEVNYVPKGFKKTEDYGYAYLYIKADKSFAVQKLELCANIGFDTEKNDSENIRINGIDAVYYRSDCKEKGIIFNNGEYIYIISGNIDKEKLINIAQNIE